MKCRLTILVASLIFVFSAQALIAKGRSQSSHPQSIHSSGSKKSMVPGSRDGKFEGSGPGGSSHKGQHYKNSKTGNHDRNRHAGVPR
jgi:hypothetical protein